MIRRSWPLVLGIVAAATLPVAAVELLTNGAFEEAGGPPPGWTFIESDGLDSIQQIGFADADGGDGELGAWLRPFVGGGDPPGQLVDAIITQTVPVAEGAGYTFTGWSRWEPNYSGGVDTLSADSPFGAIPSPTRTEMELAFLDAGGNVIGSPFNLDLRTEQNNFNFWVQHNFDDTFNGGSPIIAPAGTASARVTAQMIDGAFNTNPQQSAFFDDLSLVEAGSGNEMLVNGFLDEGPPEFPGWDVIEDPDGRNTVSAQTAAWAQNSNTSGTTGAWLRPWSSGSTVGDENDAIMSQTVEGTAGGTYTFSGWSRWEGNFSGGVDTLSSDSPSGAVPSPTQTTMEMLFLDAGGQVIDSQLLDLRSDRETQAGGMANDANWYQHTIQAVAPAGTAEVRVVASMIDGVVNVDPQQSAFFDDFSLDGPGVGGVDGDFNDDDLWDCADIDALSSAIASGSSDVAFDMNGDGNVDLNDITGPGGWLEVGGANNPSATSGNPFLSGDANLDGVVDVSDFNIWNGSKFNPSAWCNGDFNADGSADVSDFNVWNANKFSSSAAPAAVPEPAAGALACLAGLACFVIRRR